MKISIVKSALLLGTTLLFALPATAQQDEHALDYVITLKGDSIPCRIKIPLFGNPRYEVAGINKANKIKPDEIKAYYIARKKTLWGSVFKNGKNERQFMTVIEKGKISLYELINNGSTYNGTTTTTTTTTTWYISKGSDIANEIKTSGLFSSKARQDRKKEFGEMLKDDTNVYDKFMKDDNFGFKEIRNLIHLYNTGEPYKKGVALN